MMREYEFEFEEDVLETDNMAIPADPQEPSDGFDKSGNDELDTELMDPEEASRFDMATDEHDPAVLSEEQVKQRLHTEHHKNQIRKINMALKFLEGYPTSGFTLTDRRSEMHQLDVDQEVSRAKNRAIVGAYNALTEFFGTKVTRVALKK